MSFIFIPKTYTAKVVWSESSIDLSISKINVILIKDNDYIDSQKAIVDQDEYKETMTHLSTIVSDVDQYINTYVAHVDGSQTLHPREYARKYQFSTLPYFHDILNI